MCILQRNQVLLRLFSNTFFHSVLDTESRKFRLLLEHVFWIPTFVGMVVTVEKISGPVLVPVVIQGVFDSAGSAGR